jgi:predicted O-methyltransferase YrrM
MAPPYPLLTRRRAAAVFVVAAACAAAAWLAPHVGIDPAASAIVVGLPCALAAVLAAIPRAGAHEAAIARALDLQLRQTEALLSLHAALTPRAALPPTRGWAACPDLLLAIAQEIDARRPRLVVECGSGASTVIAGLALRRAGAGRLVSFEHDASYAAQTREWLRAHDLDGICEVIVAPLAPVDARGERISWYDAAPLDAALTEPIDLLVIDGPPGRPGELARYPALPLLGSRLAKGARVLLDDGDRPEERAIGARWCAEDGLSMEELALERTCLRFTRRSAAGEA